MIISTLLMVKNEKKRISVTLESIKNITDSIIVYDTGSTDNTIEIIETFCKNNNIILHIKQGTFVNFEISRNESLDFANTIKDIDFLILLDCNDELKTNKETLLNLLTKHKNEKGFFINQELYNGIGETTSWKNIKIIKHNTGWRYKGVVHEFIYNLTYDYYKTVTFPKQQVKIFQDKLSDDFKSIYRYSKDKELLYNEYLKNPNDTRTTYYLAQTYECLGEIKFAYDYYKIRSYKDNYIEEKFLATYKCGLLSQQLNYTWETSFNWYIKAFEIIQRAEPLVKIADYYKLKQNWILCYMFSETACKIKYPENCKLFVDNFIYDYSRWQILSVCAWYNQSYDIGKMACLKCITHGFDIENNIKNLELYQNKKN